MPTTGVSKQPYPNSSAVPDVPGDILLLAQRVDLFSGTAQVADAAGLAAMATATDAYDGVLATQRDTRVVYQRVSGAWVVTLEDTGWTNLTLTGSPLWTISGGLTPSVRRKNGVVYFRGRITGGTGAPFTVPAGFRPGQNSRFAIADGTSGVVMAHLTIDTAGAVVVTSGSVPNLGSLTPYLAEN